MADTARSIKVGVASALFALSALTLGPAALAQEEEGVFEDGYQGLYEDEAGFGEDDWFFDSYGADGIAENEYNDWGWYENEYYTGIYDDNYGDDWFYDSYDDPGDEGIFDV